jgi:acyl-CoA synthetase (AMP-forming)/AMP-acid ligase II
LSAYVETLAARVTALATEAPHRSALQIGSAEAKTYAWLDAEMKRYARSMAALGVEPRTRVVIDATRGEEYVVQLLAGWHLSIA